MTGARAADPPYLASLRAGYDRAFEATVVATPPEGVVLSQSLFYPVGGGQEADHGTLVTPDGTRVAVVDVRRMSGAVVHRLEKGGLVRFRIGMTVRGEIDWARRYTHMRLHTAQHLLSALAFDRYGLRTSEAAMSGHGGYLDLEGMLDGEEPIRRLEEEANSRYFTQPVQVESAMVSRAEFEAMPGRSSAKSLPQGISSVRLVLIEGIDRCPCGGTHVLSTGEVGRVRVFRDPKGKVASTRLSFELLEEREGPPSPP